MTSKRVSWLIAGVMLASSVLGARPAAALECIRPDAVPPLVYGIEESFSLIRTPDQPTDIFEVLVFPQGPDDIGTRVDAVVDDRNHVPEEYQTTVPNLVSRALLQIDVNDANPDNDVAVEMKPVDGRFGGIREPVYAIISPAALGPGPHEFQVTGQDSCGNVRVHREWIFHVPPFVGSSCEGEPEVCDI